MSHRYSHAPRPNAAPISFVLEGRGLTVDSGRKVDIVQLGSVEQVRLSYETRSLGRSSYRTQVRLKDGKTFSFSNLNWKGFVEAERLDRAYGAFAAALIGAIASANPQARFLAGRPRWLWTLGAVLAGGSLLGIAAVAWQAWQADATGAALLVAFVGLAGIWQIEPMIRLNRPRHFSPDAPPRELLPG